MNARTLIALCMVGYGLLVGFALVLARSAGERDVVYQTRPPVESRNVILKRRAHDWAKDEAL